MCQRVRLTFLWLCMLEVGRDSAVGIATAYGLWGPEIESRWGGGDFPHPSIATLGRTQRLVQWAPHLFRG
jgi:hypothetical protein